jgi:hypothetical protein
LDLKFQKQKSYILVSATGQVSEAAIIRMGEEVKIHCEEEGLNGAIVDCGKIEGALSPMELYHATNKFIDILGDIKVAYINPPSDWIPDDDQFSRDVAYNRGGELEVFPSLNDAEKWLSS